MGNLGKKNLFIELKNEKYVITVGEYDEEFNLTILENKTFVSKGIKYGKIFDLSETSKSLKSGLSEIEEKVNYVFDNANVILNTDFDCINISGFKKLNGNQILSEDISYILNDLKMKIADSEKNKTIVHIFNTKYEIDKKSIKNLPIGLHGNFYIHDLSFFLVNNNDYKNINQLLNKCNLNLSRFILKSFIDGVGVIKEKKRETFFLVKIDKEYSHVIFFLESAFCYYEKFGFGSDIILKDISKVCGLDIEIVNKFISDIDLVQEENLSQKFLDKRYFTNQKYKKISFEHILNICNARIDEIIDLIISKNINLKNFDKRNLDFYIYFEDNNLLKNLSHQFKKRINSGLSVETDYNFEANQENTAKIFSELISRGWVKEAIPVTKKKKSLISRIFSLIFD